MNYERPRVDHVAIASTPARFMMYEDYMTEEQAGGVENKRDPLIWILPNKVTQIYWYYPKLP